MSIYAYNRADADAAAEDLHRVMNSIESTLGVMDSDIQKLAAGWEGSEQEQYRGVHGKWSTAAENIKVILGQVRAALDQNTASVSETRNRVARTIAGE
ncbi:hypothetical protein CGLAU_01210 [Corynebacterium glaucum]|uniref:ESAT-6-like protein n=1 Tax=Corynebacterium glaucum TaxID=187491 RepID=A0A1Q2HTR6_9CORY|nr:WXG100 family type VII secretion target [Corynebacterium glaucum]AQQ14233.1 hypothetical protein CGLAU_01210 [Corynebacterium glaucum]WJZ06756.1 WXG domain conatining protein [Corynebacterium glaucum]